MTIGGTMLLPIYNILRAMASGDSAAQSNSAFLIIAGWYWLFYAHRVISWNRLTFTLTTIVPFVLNYDVMITESFLKEQVSRAHTRLITLYLDWNNVINIVVLRGYNHAVVDLEMILETVEGIAGLYELIRVRNAALR